MNSRDSKPVAIRISGVSKRYRIYSKPWYRLKDALGLQAQFKEFNALHDVSFDIHHGEFWGIVGRNGSGKSTLLKMVAGQLQPTSGSIACEGRVTLLQLGLGFDPELTGLENIRQSRMLQNLSSDFEDVEHFVREFSELGDFIHYPVKTYSSGMHSRLGFATAVAGDPDILIADEVLAVGDMNFSQKCLGKMREFKERGKTVVLVTHDVNAVKSFCDHAVWLNDGRLISLGQAKLVADDFRNFMLYGVTSSLSSTRDDSPACVIELAQAATELPVAGAQADADPVASGAGAPASAAISPAAQAAPKNTAAPAWIVPNAARRTVSDPRASIERYRFVDDQTGETLPLWRPQTAIRFDIMLKVHAPMRFHSAAFTLHDRNGLIAVHLNSEFFGQQPVDRGPGTWLASFRFDTPLLADADYSISLGFSEGDEGTLLEKYDYDSGVTIAREPSVMTDRQGGYFIVPAGAFEMQAHA